MRNGHAIITLAFALLACGKDPSKPEQTIPPGPHRDLYLEAADRLLEMTEPRGWVVSQWEDGRIEHTGDSLLWTGMAMGVLDCERGAIPEAALLDMLKETGGKVYRHPSEKDREPSLDGHLGLYWGIAHRTSRCPDSAQKWAEALTSHKPVNVPAPFDAVLKSIRGESPKTTALEAAVASWALAVTTSKAAGYRIHLGLLALEATGVRSSKFCAATRGAGMPTVEHYCGRGDLAAWVDDFKYDVWEFRHQRAKWESPDGKPGLKTPALDLLVALRELYEPLPFNQPFSEGIPQCR